MLDSSRIEGDPAEFASKDSCGIVYWNKRVGKRSHPHIRRPRRSGRKRGSAVKSSRRYSAEDYDMSQFEAGDCDYNPDEIYKMYNGFISVAKMCEWDQPGQIDKRVCELTELLASLAHLADTSPGYVSDDELRGRFYDHLSRFEGSLLGIWPYDIARSMQALSHYVTALKTARNSMRKPQLFQSEFLGDDGWMRVGDAVYMIKYFGQDLICSCTLLRTGETFRIPSMLKSTVQEPEINDREYPCDTNAINLADLYIAAVVNDCQIYVFNVRKKVWTEPMPHAEGLRLDPLIPINKRWLMAFTSGLDYTGYKIIDTLDPESGWSSPVDLCMPTSGIRWEDGEPHQDWDEMIDIGNVVQASDGTVRIYVCNLSPDPSILGYVDERIDVSGRESHLTPI
ncbi:MAG: hypothetical protein P4M11_09860 [Candidatus Pacebacteria bacterium]|nr:hypothetical protein [Candidatus Paceibacterota bacterium]